MPLTTDAPPVAPPGGNSGGPGDTTSVAPITAPNVSQPPDDVVQKVKGLLGAGHSIDELKQSKLYAQYGDPLIAAATAKPSSLESLLAGVANVTGSGAEQALHGATKAITGIPSAIASAPEMIMRAANMGQQDTPGGPISGMGTPSPLETIPIVHKALAAIHDALDPISQSLAEAVNPMFPTNSQLHNQIDPENKHPALTEGFLNGTDVIGNLAASYLLGKVGDAVGGKMIESNKPKAVDTVTSLDKAIALKKPQLNEAYNEAYKYSINPNISPKVQELIHDPAFPKALDRAIDTFDSSEPWMKDLKDFRDSITPKAPDATPSVEAMTGRYTAPVNVENVEKPMGSMPVAGVDYIKRYIQRGVISMDNADPKLLNREEAYRLKNILNGPKDPTTGIRSNGAIDQVDAQLPKIGGEQTLSVNSTSAQPENGISAYEHARNLGQDDIQSTEARDFMYKNMSSHDQGAVDVAKGTLDQHINNISNNLEKGNGGFLAPVMKTILSAFRSKSVRPAGIAANAIINAATNPQSDGELLAAANRMPGATSRAMIEKNYMDAASKSNGDVVSTLLHVLPLSTVVPLIKQMHGDSTQAPITGPTQ
jgi:hypothetical protein